jgi:ABC-type phosphate/phosphonate transport system substrate-binding protein
MKTILILICLCLYSFANSPNLKNLIVYTKGFPEIQRKDAEIAIDTWMSHLDFRGVKVNLEFVDDDKEAIDKYINKNYDFLALNTINYIDNKNNLDPYTIKYMTTVMGYNAKQKYTLLVNRDSNIKTIKDLKNKKVAIIEHFNTGKIFLDKELLEKTNEISDTYLNLQRTKKHSTTILKTFFKKFDACVVPTYKFDFMLEMNPSISKKLFKLKESEKIFIPTMSLFRKKDLPNYEEFVNELIVYSNIAEENSLLSIFKLRKIVLIKKEDFYPMIRYYKRYQYLLEKSK